jgi:hypothetical protein
MGLWNPTLRKVREGWGNPRVVVESADSRFLDSARNDKILRWVGAQLKLCPSRAWCIPSPQRDGVAESHPSQSARIMGHPGLWWCRLTAGSSTPQGHPLCGLSFSARNDKVLRGLTARLKSCPSRAWRFPNPQRDGVVESHPSQSARRMGQPLSWWCRLTAGSSPGFQPCSE